MNKQGVLKSKKLVIEDDVWIGARVIISPSVKKEFVLEVLLLLEV